MRDNAVKGHSRSASTRGAAMILVLCILAVFFALGVSLLLAASSLNAAAQQKLKQEYCYELAKSFSFALRDRLDASGGGEDRFAAVDTVESAENTLAETIYLLTNRLPNADEAVNATRFLSSGDTLGGDYGTVSVSLRREDYDEAGGEGDAVYDCILYITVRVEKYGTSYDYTTVYLRKLTEEVTGGTEPQYYYNGRPVMYQGTFDSNSWFYLDGDQEKVHKIDHSKIEIRQGETVKESRYSFWYQNGGPS